MSEHCGNGCNGCSSNGIKVENSEENTFVEIGNIIKGYINIYDVGGFLQSNSGIYDTEEKAKETGKLIKGYITTVFISFPFKEKF